MISALWNGISGLNTFEKALDVESNNSTNAATVGYKSDIINFADLMYKNDISGQYGTGSTISGVTKAMYEQGGIKITNDPYNVAIEGKGYFIVQDVDNKGQKETFYTRAGNFKIAENGLLQTQNNMSVLGASSTNSSDSTNAVTKFNNSYSSFIASQTIGSLSDLKTINAKSTDYTASAVSDNILNSGSNYKTKSSKINDVDALILDYKNKLKTYSLNPNDTPKSSTSQITNISFSNFKDLIKDESSSIGVSIDGNKISQPFISKISDQTFKENFYSKLAPSDQLIYGDPAGVLSQSQKDMYNLEASKIATMNAFSDKVSSVAGLTSSIDLNTGVLNITSLIPGKDFNINQAYINNQSYDSQIATSSAVMGTGIDMVTSSKDALKTALQKAGANFLEISSDVSLSDENSNTLSNLSNLQLNLSNLNISDTSVGSVEITDGIIYVTEGSNKFIVGKLETAAFVNEQGLQAQGNNLFQASKDAGTAYNAVNLNKLVGTSLEESKANLANSLTALLIYQKAFEANSKSITTSDEMLQTAIQLKK